MSLDKLLEPMPEPEPKLCKVGQIVAELEEPYKGALLALLNQPHSAGGFTDEVLQRRMTEAGLIAGASVINRHRRGICLCAAR